MWAIKDSKLSFHGHVDRAAFCLALRNYFQSKTGIRVSPVLTIGGQFELNQKCVAVLRLLTITAKLWLRPSLRPSRTRSFLFTATSTAPHFASLCGIIFIQKAFAYPPFSRSGGNWNYL